MHRCISAWDGAARGAGDPAAPIVAGRTRWVERLTRLHRVATGATGRAPLALRRGRSRRATHGHRVKRIGAVVRGPHLPLYGGERSADQRMSGVMQRLLSPTADKVSYLLRAATCRVEMW